MEVQIDKGKVVDRKLDGKGRISLKEFANPGQKVEIAVLEVKDE
jgi:hypothetical protein